MEERGGVGEEMETCRDKSITYVSPQIVAQYLNCRVFLFPVLVAFQKRSPLL